MNIQSFEFKFFVFWVQVKRPYNFSRIKWNIVCIYITILSGCAFMYSLLPCIGCEKHSHNMEAKRKQQISSTKNVRVKQLCTDIKMN